MDILNGMELKGWSAADVHAITKRADHITKGRDLMVAADKAGADVQRWGLAIGLDFLADALESGEDAVSADKLVRRRVGFAWEVAEHGQNLTAGTNQNYKSRVRTILASDYVTVEEIAATINETEGAMTLTDLYHKAQNKEKPAPKTLADRIAEAERVDEILKGLESRGDFVLIVTALSRIVDGEERGAILRELFTNDE